ncbi:Sorting nexin-9 [Desmophyllum pertusum]|uniref:Sorting nexin-9 n=1 Tax=Desmophyllum pertusum TaxID=174260 RepID=A0A9X0A290_9CNID|nr:Sorting nexin-9 [Desmophyllum pertusum]
MAVSPGCKVRVLYDFEGDVPSGELVVYEGEILTVSRTDVGDGWWEGISPNGSKGLFPEAYVEVIDYSPPQSNNFHPLPIPTAPLHNQVSVDTADGWDDEWDDDETVSSYSGGDHESTISALPTRRDTNSSGIVRTGTVRKSINRFSHFVKSGGEAYIIGASHTDVKIPKGEIVTIGEEGNRITWDRSPQPFTCVINAPEKKSKFKGMKSFIAYNIIPSSSGIVVSRRYKHFDWLYDRFVEKFTCISVPPLPDKQITGRFGEEFVEKRKEKLQLWMSRICLHPVLSQSMVFNHFLTCGDNEKEWKQGKRKAECDKLVGASFFVTVESPPQTLELLAVENRMEQFGRFIKNMDESVKAIQERGQAHCEKCQGSYRHEYKKIGSTFGSLSTAFAIDVDSENSHQLTQAVEHTGKTFDDIGEMLAEQPKNDFLPLIEGLKEYSGMLSTFPDVLQVHKGTIGKVKECQRLKDEEKMEDSTFEEIKERADTITNVSFAEMSHFHDQQVADFKNMMQHFLQEQISYHHRVIQKLEDSLRMYDNIQ